MQNALGLFILPLAKSLNSIKLPFKDTGRKSVKARRRNEHTSIFVLLKQRFNAWPALGNMCLSMEKYIALIVAVTAQKYYRVKNSILSRLNWMMNKTKLF